MKKNSLLLLFIANFGIIFSQNCEQASVNSLSDVGTYPYTTLVEADGLRNGPDYDGATIYYPTDMTEPHKSIVIVPGFFGNQTDVEAWGPFLASHGIITMTIGTNLLYDLPDIRANALVDGIETLKQENSRSGSPLIGLIDTTNFAVAGWSMGGGGAQLAAVLDPSIKAVLAFCPWLDTSTPPALNHNVPVLIFSGEDDPTAPPVDHANVHYITTPSQTDKVIYEIAGGVHNVANTPAGANGDIGKLGLAWLNKYLIEDYCYCPLIVDTLLNQPALTSSFSHNLNCDLLSTNNKKIDELKLFPNPTNSIINIVNNYDNLKEYKIVSVLGKIVKTGMINSNNSNLNLTNLNNGIYYLIIDNVSYKIVKTN